MYDTPLPGKQKTMLLPLIISLALAKSHSGSFFGFAATGDFAGGQIALLEADGYTITEKNVYFVGKSTTFTAGSTQYSYIEIS